MDDEEETFTPVSIGDADFDVNDPNAMEEIDQVLTNDAETTEKQKELQESIQEQEKAVIKIEVTLTEREKLLEAVKESKNFLETKLLEEMKKEYYIKIHEMEDEIEILKKSHTQNRKIAPASKVSQLDAKYDDKISEMTARLNDYRIKEKEQKTLKKDIEKSINKIKTLESDIQKIRT